ncbi:MAG: hypothetical protein ABIV13_04395 [Fimbriimonadales bacterium]
MTAAVLFAQGVLTILWWPWISASDQCQRLFFAPDTAGLVLSKFAAPDLIAFGGGSLTAAALVLSGSKAAGPASWFVVGAAAYASIGAIAVNWPIFSVPLADVLVVATLASRGPAAPKAFR